MSVLTRARMMGRSVASRRVVTYRKPNFTGYFPSGKNRRQIQYESLLERDYILLLEADPHVISYREQPPPINWTDGVCHFTTTFDFEVSLSKPGDPLNLKYLVEIKPAAKVRKYRLDELYGHARAAAISQGYLTLELWTEREIRALPRLTNAELIGTAITNYFDPSHELAANTALRQLLTDTDRFTIRQFRRAFNAEQQGYRTAVRMIARGQLVPIDATAPLDDSAVLTVPSSTRLAA